MGFSVHNGIIGFCANKLNTAAFLNSFFIANHYPLSPEHYGFRKGDSRGVRGKHTFKKYQSQAIPKFNTDNMVRGWVRKFVDEVGTEDAEILLSTTMFSSTFGHLHPSFATSVSLN